MPLHNFLTGLPLPAPPQDPQGRDHHGEQRDGGRLPRLLRHPPQPVQRERAVRHPAGEAPIQLDAGDDQEGGGRGNRGLTPAATTTVTTSSVLTRSTRERKQEEPPGTVTMMIGSNSLS